MITGRQIRAARALIDISQDELAEATGLTPQAIRKIENGSVTPREGTIGDILQIFNERGVEFMEDRGVALRDDEITTYMGQDAFIKLLEDIGRTLKNERAPEALFACVSDAVSPPIVIENYRLLRKTGIKMRSLVKEGDTYLMGKLDEYRYLPSRFFHNNATVIYGNKFATMILDPETGKDVGSIILRNTHIALSQKNLFEFMWSVGNIPQKSTAKEFYDG